jgi:hypothetical protein
MSHGRTPKILTTKRTGMNTPKALSPDGSTTRQNTRHHDQAPPPSYRASVAAEIGLDIPQRIERKLAQYNASQNTFKRWLFEIFSVTTSAICMGEGDQHQHF